jgi:hypothetical protein
MSTAVRLTDGRATAVRSVLALHDRTADAG